MPTKRIYPQGELKEMYFRLRGSGHRKASLWHDRDAANEARRFLRMLAMVDELRKDKAFDEAYRRRIGDA